MKFLADENLHGFILQGLQNALPDLDIIRVQDTDLSGADDVRLLEYAGSVGAIVITHDVSTLPGFAFDRVRQGKPMPGIIEVSAQMPPRAVIGELVLLIAAGSTDDFENQVRFIPLV